MAGVRCTACVEARERAVSAYSGMFPQRIYKITYVCGVYACIQWFN